MRTDSSVYIVIISIEFTWIELTVRFSLSIVSYIIGIEKCMKNARLCIDWPILTYFWLDSRCKSINIVFPLFIHFVFDFSFIVFVFGDFFSVYLFWITWQLFFKINSKFELCVEQTDFFSGKIFTLLLSRFFTSCSEMCGEWYLLLRGKWTAYYTHYI